MNFTWGQNIRVTLFGESHGPCVGVCCDGLPAGMAVDMDNMNARLELRRPWGDISTGRHEADKPVILSGVFQGRTDGAPLVIMMENTAHRPEDYPARVLRPSHADLTSYVKLGGFNDYRGGGSFSGRMTAPLVALGAVLAQALEEKGIYIGSHISRCGDICDEDFPEDDDGEITEIIKRLNGERLALIDPSNQQPLMDIITEARANGDSVGGVVETAAVGIPAGLGQPFFHSMESVISHLLFSIPGVKGVEFGLGFGFAYLCGSEVNDQLVVQDGRIRTKSNFSGGINGGITNGMPVIFRTALRPTPSIASKQQTVDLETMEERELELSGRHDPAIFHRARVVIDSVTAMAIFDMTMGRGMDVWEKGL